MDERSIRANSVRPDGYSPKKKKKKRRLPWYFWVLVSLLMLAAAALTAVSVHYRDMFYPHTEILGVDVSSLGAPEAAERLSSAAGASVLSLGDGAGPELCRTALADYLEDGVLSDTAAALLAEQHRNPLGWLNRNGYAYAPALLSELTAERTAEVLDRALYGEGEPVRPRDARVVLGETGFELEPEVDGDLVDVDRCAAAVAEALRGVTSLT